MVNVLIIGGSTFNKGDDGRMASILTDPNNSFLKEWAVIIAFHSFCLFNDVKPSGRNKQNVDHNEHNRRNLNLFQTRENDVLRIDTEGEHLIENNKIYILGGGGVLPPFLCFKVKERNNSLFLEAKWYSDNEGDTFDCENRQANSLIAVYYPSINCVMEEFLANYDKLQDLAGVVLAGFDNDGAEGLLAMKRNDCKTAVQNPEECNNERNFEMPQNALNALNALKTFNIENNPKLEQHDIITLGTAEFPTFVEWFSNLNDNT